MLKPVKRHRSRTRSVSRRIRCGDLLPNLQSNLCSSKRWNIECEILSKHWKLVVFSIAMQFIHGICSNVAYYNYVPGEPLSDVGFGLLPELDTSTKVLSEYLGAMALLLTVVMGLLGPFCHKRPRYYSVCYLHFLSLVSMLSLLLFVDQQSTLFIRCTSVMACCLVLRCICFLYLYRWE